MLLTYSGVIFSGSTTSFRFCISVLTPSKYLKAIESLFGIYNLSVSEFDLVSCSTLAKPSLSIDLVRLSQNLVLINREIRAVGCSFILSMESVSSSPTIANSCNKLER